MTSRISSVLLALSLATTAQAQAVVDSVTSDLNGDGLAERFTLLHDGGGTADLIIEDTGTGRITAPGLVWIGGIGQEPTLDLAPNGSVRITSMNEAIGRNRWHQTLTIAYRKGAYLVAGYTYDYYDTLDLDDAGMCDLNLLNAMGVIARGQGPKEPIAHTVVATPITEWSDETPIPQVCRLWEQLSPASSL